VLEVRVRDRIREEYVELWPDHIPHLMTPGGERGAGGEILMHPIVDWREVARRLNPQVVWEIEEVMAGGRPGQVGRMGGWVLAPKK